MSGSDRLKYSVARRVLFLCHIGYAADHYRRLNFLTGRIDRAIAFHLNNAGVAIVIGDQVGEVIFRVCQYGFG